MNTKDKVIVLASAILIILFCYSASILISGITEDFRLYQAEGACVKSFIISGYERKDIKTANGTCWIKE